jgi:hypothetical protein
MASPKANDLRKALLDAKTENKGELPLVLWLSTTQKFLDALFTPRNDRPTESPTKLHEGLPDADWIAYLEGLPHLQGVDIKREIGKCQLWASTNNQKPTRRRIVNWLNKSEKTVIQSFRGASSFRPHELSVGLVEPDGWRDEFPDSIHIQKGWDQIPEDSRKLIAQEMKRLHP